MDEFNQNNQQNNFQQNGYQQPQQTGFQGQPYQQGFQQGGFQQPYQQAGFQGQPYQQQGFQQGGYQQTMTNQYYQPGTNQYIQPGMNMYGYQRTPALSCAKNVVSMVFGIVAFFFSFLAGAMASTLHYYTTRGNRYSYHLLEEARTACVITCVFEAIFVFVSILLGIMGLAGKTRGKGMSIAGVICAVLGLVFTIICGTTGMFR